jgi:hypothetical protein
MVPAASCLAYCWAAWACEAKAGHSGAFPGRKAIHRVDPKPTANPPSKLLLWASKNDDREKDNVTYPDRYAFCHRRCAIGRNADQQRAINVFISMVRDLTRRR